MKNYICPICNILRLFLCFFYFENKSRVTSKTTKPSLNSDTPTSDPSISGSLSFTVFMWMYTMACCLGIKNYLYSNFSTEKRWCFCTCQIISCCTFKACKAAVTSLCIIVFKGRVINHRTLTFGFVTTRVRAGSATHFGIKSEGKGEVFHGRRYLRTYVLLGMITWCSADVNVP